MLPVALILYRISFHMSTILFGYIFSNLATFCSFFGKKAAFFGKNEKSLYFLIHECAKILRLFQKFTPESADYAEHEKFS